MINRTNDTFLLNKCFVFSGIINRLLSILVLLIFTCVLLHLNNRLNSGIAHDNDIKGLRNRSDLDIAQDKDCNLRNIFFNNGISAVYCEDSPAPVFFYKKGIRECSVPVLALQAVVFILTYNSTGFHQLLTSLKIEITRESSGEIEIGLPGGIYLRPKDSLFSSKIDFIGKLHKISRIGGS